MVTSPETFPFMVIGNKLDLEEENRVVERAQAEAYCKKDGKMAFMETSAKDNLNVEQAFAELAAQAIKRQAEM